MKPLNRTTAGLPQSRPVKVLQFGKGNFLRAFTEWMVEVMNETSDFNGAVQIVQTNSTEDDHRFVSQEGLYHLVINGIKNGKAFREIKLVKSVDSLINPFANYESYLRAGENPDLEIIISNTTEAGIVFDPSDDEHNRLPRTFPGKLTALLYRRFRFFNGDPSRAPLILPCELIERNGEALRSTILSYAELWKLPDAFRSWIADHTGFCNTLVDRIVPGFPKDNIEEVWSETGFRDELVVSAEPYHLWVLEPITKGLTCEKLARILPLEKAGINIKCTNNLDAYRTIKVRILNGAHTTMVPIAWLRGIRTVRDAIDDTVVGTFVREAIEKEIIPTLSHSQEELGQFASDVVERFRNPFIRHELSAIALNSVSKFQVRVLPSILEYHRLNGGLPERLLESLAALIVFYKGEWKGEATPVRDTPEVLHAFKEAWDTHDPVRSVLANETLWKTDLTRISGLSDAVEQAVKGLLNRG